MHFGPCHSRGFVVVVVLLGFAAVVVILIVEREARSLSPVRPASPVLCVLRAHTVCSAGAAALPALQLSCWLPRLLVWMEALHCTFLVFLLCFAGTHPQRTSQTRSPEGLACGSVE